MTELSRGRPIIPQLLAHHQARTPHAASVHGLEAILIALLQEADVVYLHVDALDECSEERREEVVQGLQNITQACTNMRLLITSRREGDIQDLLKDWCNDQIALDEGCINTDIDLFVMEAWATDMKLMRLPLSAKEDIKKSFHQKSDGMSVPYIRSNRCLLIVAILTPSRF